MHTRSLHPEASNIDFVSKQHLIANSDIISIHMPLNNETKHFISFREFDQMKDNTILINTARGLIVNQEALIDALINKKIAGAASDVFEIEPPLDPQYPLLHIDNFLALPHIGYYTEEALEKRADIGIDNFLNYLNGKITNEVC